MLHTVFKYGETPVKIQHFDLGTWIENGWHTDEMSAELAYRDSQVQTIDVTSEPVGETAIAPKKGKTNGSNQTEAQA